MAEDLPVARAVHPGGLDLLVVAALQAGQEDQHHERRPLPDQRGLDGQQRGARDPVRLGAADVDCEQSVEKADLPGCRAPCFQSRAAATGTTRKGAMRSILTMPRPRNLRSRSRARPRPMTRLATTTAAVRRIVVQTEWRRSGSVRTSE